MFEIFTSPDAWVALLSLTFLEIILGIDNIVFISITANKLPKDHIGLIFSYSNRIYAYYESYSLIGNRSI